MIPGWEDFTEEISKKDMPKVNRIVTGLKRTVGKKNAVTNATMRKKLRAEGIIVKDPKMRKIIQYIRQNNLIPRLCSNGKGYYVAANDEEWLEWVESYRRRTNAMIYTLKCAIQGENVLNFDDNQLKKI